MPSKRAALVFVGACLTSLVAACGQGSSQTKPTTTDPGALSCLTNLAHFCCTDAGSDPSCVADFDSAQRCASWPAGSNVQVYATPCQGLKAIRVATSVYSTFYMYDAANSGLKAIGDNAAASDPRSTAIECGAGPNNFLVPGDCGSAWLSTSGAQACAGGASTPASVCQ